MNSWSFTGNLGKDAETRHTGDGDPVVQFSVGVKSGYGKNESTTWARCTMWGKRGEAVAPYLTKGQSVGIVGEASLREYEKDGVKRYSLDVRVNDLTLLGKREGQAQESKPKPDQKSAPASGNSFSDFEDDMPFIDPYKFNWRAV